MIRMIALDVDGTLLTSNGTLTEGTVRAIRAAREQGVRVVLSTGRSAPEAVWLTRMAGCDNRAVCLGGAAIADMADGRHLRRWGISRRRWPRRCWSCSGERSWPAWCSPER